MDELVGPRKTMRARNRPIPKLLLGIIILTLVVSLMLHGIRGAGQPDYDSLASYQGVTEYQKMVYSKLRGLLSKPSLPAPDGIDLPAFYNLDALPPLVDALADAREVAVDRRRLSGPRTVRMCEVAAG